MNDEVVLTRKVNHAELIFNQKISDDNVYKCRFFKKDAGADWFLSPKHECYVC